MVKKISRLKPQYIKYLEVGSITNMLTIDNHRIGTALHLSHRVFGVLWMTILLTGLLWLDISWIALAIPIIVFVALLICHQADHWVYRLISKKMVISDKRGEKTKEMVSGIKIIKFNALENIIANILIKFKLEEKKYCILIMVARGLGEGLFLAVPPFCTLVCIFGYEQVFDKK